MEKETHGIWSHHLMANRKGKGGSSDRFYFLGSKITVDSDCRHQTKRRLLLGRKAMTNIDSVLKSRDTTLPTKVRIVKAMVFPVVMYVSCMDAVPCMDVCGCESWTLKKAERRRIDAFEL